MHLLDVNTDNFDILVWFICLISFDVFNRMDNLEPG